MGEWAFSRWSQLKYVYFSSLFGEDEPNLTVACFLDGLVQPPTSFCFSCFFLMIFLFFSRSHASVEIMDGILEIVAILLEKITHCFTKNHDDVGGYIRFFTLQL